MTDTSLNSLRQPLSTTEDMTLPIVVYVLYILALPSAFLSLLIGVVLAYANRDTAGPAARSHYDFLIRTFWLSLVLLGVATAACVVGGVLSVILIGIPILIVGVLMLVGAKLWYLLRCIVGLVAAARREAYPRPEALLV